MKPKDVLLNDMYKVITDEYIPETEWKKVLPMISILHLKKGDYLIKENEVPEKIAFISSGIMRYFCTNNYGEEKTIVLRGKGRFISAYTSHLENKESKLSIQALEESTILYIPINYYEELLRTNSYWRLFAWKQAMDVIIEKERREMEILSYDAETKYKRFKEEFPGMENRINHYHIASYLGISNVTLSRVRKKMIKNKTPG